MGESVMLTEMLRLLKSRGGKAACLKLRVNEDAGRVEISFSVEEETVVHRSDKFVSQVQLELSRGASLVDLELFKAFREILEELPESEVE